MLGLGFPEVARRHHLCDDFSWPQAGSIDLRDQLLGDPLLLFARIEDRGAIARPDIIALPVERRRVVNLEEVLQQIAIGQARGIENDLDRLSVSLVITVCGVGNLAARIPDARRDYSVQAAKKIL